MTLRYTHLTSDHKWQAVRAVAQCGNEVPIILTTAWRREAEQLVPVFDIVFMGR
jgi:hypothetical protein